MSAGHSFAHGYAGGGNGYAVSGGSKKAKGCVNAAYAEMPVVTSGGDANCVHAFAAVSASGSYFGSVFFRLLNCLAARRS
jgi:hypothetical protein